MASLGKLFAGAASNGVNSSSGVGAGVTGSKIVADNLGNLFTDQGDYITNYSMQDGFHNRGKAGGGTGKGGGGKGGGKKRDLTKPAGKYKDDGALHMPNADATLEAIRKVQQQLAATSGRASTNLTTGPRSYFGDLARKR